MSNVRAFQHLLSGLGREMIEGDNEGGGGSSAAPAPAPPPQQTYVPTSTVPGLPDLIYGYYGTGVFYDLNTHQPTQAAAQGGYTQIANAGDPDSYTGMVSPSLAVILRNLPVMQDNRGNQTFATVYASNAAIEAFRPTQYNYQPPTAGYNAPLPAPAPAPSSDDGRQSIPYRPTGQPRGESLPPLVSAPAPTPPPAAPGSTTGGATWGSEGTLDPSTSVPGEAPASGGKGWLIAAAIAAAFLSR